MQVNSPAMAYIDFTKTSLQFSIEGTIGDGDRSYSFSILNEEAPAVLQAFCDATEAFPDDPDDALRDWMERLTPEQKSAILLLPKRIQRPHNPWKQLDEVIAEGGFTKLKMKPIR